MSVQISLCLNFPLLFTHDADILGNFWTWLDSQILLYFFFFISEASVNLECISWKIGFCVAPTKDSDSILIYLLSTTGRGPCSYLMLKGNLWLPPIREMRRSINRLKRRIIFCFSRTWQESIQQRKRHNTHRNKPGQKRYIQRSE